MLEHIWTVVCKTGIKDAETENWSLIETLDYIDFESDEWSLQRENKAPVRFAWVTFWRREDIHKAERVYARDVVLSPSGKTLNEDKYEIDLVKYPAMYYKRDLFGEVDESGDYRFITYGKTRKKDPWSLVSNIPVFIELERKRRKSSKSKSKNSKRHKHQEKG